MGAVLIFLSLSASMAGKKWKPPPLTQNCSVCGDPASTIQHYGATVCYSCRAFFKRSVVSGKVFSVCYSNCSLTLGPSQKSCKKCRFDSCLQVGMKPESVGRMKVNAVSEKTKHISEPKL